MVQDCIEGGDVQLTDAEIAGFEKSGIAKLDALKEMI